jgi:hypothetical protein
MRATSIRTYVSEQFAYIPSRQQLLTACYLLQGDYFMRSTRDDALYTFLTAHKKDISVDAEIIDVFELIQTALTCALWDYTGERIYIDQAITQGSSLWNIKKNVWSPVVFTDLPLLLWASERTQAYQMMYEHLRSLLGRDGVLYSAQGALTYTQGVGKIMEVWAGIPDPKELVTQLSVWLASMQYTKDTVHCVAPEASAIVMRGFRCSYWNRDVWLDASAHILIGLSRLDHAQAHRSHWQTLVR